MFSAAAAETKTQCSDYLLYLLTDNCIASLTTVQLRVNGGNAVLLYPDPTDKVSSESRRYSACFIQNGALCDHPDSKKLVIVPMGNRAINETQTLPCDITSQPNAANLIKAALARAGIRLESPLFRIPDSLMRVNVLPRAEMSSLAAFASGSFYARNLSQTEIDQRGVEKLFAHIVNGEPDEVKKILDINPRLSLVRRKVNNKKDEVIRNKGRQCISVQGKTAYQVAFGEYDTEIAEILKAAIVKVADENEADAQYDEQFPHGWEEAETKKWTPIFSQLDTLAQTDRDTKPGDIISSGDPEYKLTVRDDSEIAKSLSQIRSSLEALLNEPVTTGRHFNPNLPLKAFDIYEDHFRDYFGNDRNDPRAQFFLQKVIGYSKRFFPANYLQAACDSFDNTAKQLKRCLPQNRSFKFEVFSLEHNSWYKVDLFPHYISRLGLDFAIWKGRAETNGARVMTWVEGMNGLESLCQAKTDCIQLLRFHIDVRRQNFLIWFQ